MRFHVRREFRSLLEAICLNIHTDNDLSEDSSVLFPSFAEYEFKSPNPQVEKLLKVIHLNNSSTTITILQKIIGIHEEVKQIFLKNHDKNTKFDTSELISYIPAYLTVLNLAAEIKFSEKSFHAALEFTRLVDDIFWPWDKSDPLYIKLKIKRARIYEELKQFESATLIHKDYWKEDENVVSKVPESLLYLLTNPNYRDSKKQDLLKTDSELANSLALFFHGYISFTELEYSDSLSKFIQLSGITSLQSYLLPVLAELSFLAGRKLEAIEWFKKMRKLCPEVLTNLDIYALLLYELSQLENLENLAVELNNINKTESVAYWTTMGFIATIKEKHRQAIFCGSKINQLDNLNVQAYLLKGINLESIRRFDEAVKNFYEVIQNQPYRHDGYACIVHCLIQENKLSDALRIASDAVKQLTWKNQEAIVLYMIALFENSKVDDSMLNYCENVALRALKLNPFHENVIKVLASLYFQAEKYDKVIELIGSRTSKMDMGEALLRTLNNAKQKLEENIKADKSDGKVEFKTPTILTRAQARINKGNNSIVNSPTVFPQLDMTPGGDTN